jgi:hypothetical protein
LLKVIFFILIFCDLVFKSLPNRKTFDV